jgi:small multidrug resistance pump
MSWMWLYLAIVLEVAATVCMKLSDGCSRAIPSVFMVLLYGVSFFPTVMALRRLDVGMAYAVWSAVGTTLITIIGMVLFKEQMSPTKMAALGIIIFGVVMLNLSGNGEGRGATSKRVVEMVAPISGSPVRVLLAREELRSIRSSSR